MPDTGNAGEFIQRIATVVETNFIHFRCLVREIDLVGRERVVMLPLTTEALECVAIADANGRSSWECRFVCFHSVKDVDVPHLPRMAARERGRAHHLLHSQESWWRRQ